MLLYISLLSQSNIFFKRKFLLNVYRSKTIILKSLNLSLRWPYYTGIANYFGMVRIIRLGPNNPGLIRLIRLIRPLIGEAVSPLVRHHVPVPLDLKRTPRS